MGKLKEYEVVETRVSREIYRVKAESKKEAIDEVQCGMVNSLPDYTSDPGERTLKARLLKVGE